MTISCLILVILYINVINLKFLLKEKNVWLLNTKFCRFLPKISFAISIHSECFVLKNRQKKKERTFSGQALLTKLISRQNLLFHYLVLPPIYILLLSTLFLVSTYIWVAIKKNYCCLRIGFKTETNRQIWSPNKKCAFFK